jgi:hypothetical protein
MKSMVDHNLGRVATMNSETETRTVTNPPQQPWLATRADQAALLHLAQLLAFTRPTRYQ